MKQTIVLLYELNMLIQFSLIINKAVTENNK